MARIRTYDLDSDVSANDYLLGNDGDSSSVITKRFSLDDVKSFITEGITGESIIDRVPSGFVPNVSHDNDFGDNNIDNSFIRISESPRVTGTEHEFTSADEGVMNLRLRDDGSCVIDFVNYYQPYILDQFNGIRFTITDSTQLGADGEITGVFGAMVTEIRDPDDGGTHIFGYNSDEDYYYSVVAVLDEASIQRKISDFACLTLDDTPAKIVYELFELTAQELTVRETSQFNGDVTIGSDTGTTADLHIHGDQYFDDDQGGIIFGSLPDNVTMTTDGDDLTFGGRGNVNISTDPGDLIVQTTLVMDDGNNIDIHGGDIRFLNTDGTEMTPQARIVPVAGNGRAATLTNEGVLTDIRIGDGFFTLPTAIAQTAFVLPGLGEGLAPVPDGTTGAALMTGQFFYGIDEGTFATFSSVQTGAQLQLTAGESTATVPEASDAAYVALFDGVPSGQRLFFVDSANTFDFSGPPAVGTTVTGNVYEVVNYVNNTLSFSLVGQGSIEISSPTVELSNVPTVASNTFIVRDSNNNLGVAEISDIAGAQAQVAYTNDDHTDADADFTNVRNIQFVSCNDAVDTDTAGEIVVDVTGRYPLFRGGAEQTANFPGELFRIHVLGEAPAPTDGAPNPTRTFTLPQYSTVGDSIKIVNLSTVGANGVARTSGQWRLLPHTGQRIMKLPANTEMILNDASSSFELTYVHPDIGWALIGVN